MGKQQRLNCSISRVYNQEAGSEGQDKADVSLPCTRIFHPTPRQREKQITTGVSSADQKKVAMLSKFGLEILMWHKFHRHNLIFLHFAD
jgi:aspartate carbamoyltransferase catalytic subunit